MTSHRSEPDLESQEALPGSLPSFALVLETENVESAGLDHLRTALASLEAQTVSPAQALDAVVPQSGDVPEAVLEELMAKHRWARVLPVDADLDYYQAKMAGVREARRSDVLVFADSDCDYEPDWLERLLESFRRPEVLAVAGFTGMRVRTTYEMGLSAVYFLQPMLSRRPKELDDPLASLRPGNRYLANNVAFRRELLERFPIPEGRQFLRGQCVAHAQQLDDQGVVIWSQPLARALHPHMRGSVKSFLWRFLLLGEEEVMRARLNRRGPSVLRRVGYRLFRRYLEAVWRLWRLVRDQPRLLWRLPGAAAIAMAALLLADVGAALELVLPGKRMARRVRRLVRA